MAFVRIFHCKVDNKGDNMSLSNFDTIVFSAMDL